MGLIDPFSKSQHLSSPGLFQTILVHSMRHVWQACLPCKSGVNTWRSSLAISRICPSSWGFCAGTPWLTSISLAGLLRVPVYSWQVRPYFKQSLYLYPYCLVTSIMDVNNVNFSQVMDSTSSTSVVSEEQEDVNVSSKRSRIDNSDDGTVETKTESSLGSSLISGSIDSHNPCQLFSSRICTDHELSPKQSIHTSAKSEQTRLDECDSVAEEKSEDSEDFSVDVMARRLKKLRYWDYVAKKQTYSSGLEFTIMSYNLLAQCLLEDNWYLYNHCANPNVLTWDYRKENLLRELSESNSDIFCLQEVQQDHFLEIFEPALKRMGYAAVYKKRTGNKNDGCAIFYKENVFALDCWIAVEYHKPGVTLLDRDNIAVVALLRPLKKDATDSRLCVANTHLLFNPRRGDIRLAQLRVLFAEVDRLAFKHFSRFGRPVYHPVVLCGDLNSEPHCKLYNFIGTGRLHYEGLPAAVISGQCESSSSYGRCLNSELLPPELGITDQCQYAELLPERDKQINCHKIEQCKVLKSSNSDSCSKNSEVTGEEASTVANSNPVAVNSIVESSSQQDEDENQINFDISSSEHSSKSSYSSGIMTHNFNLVSVYNHKLERAEGAPEITTHHSRASCTVDYIFYSVKRKQSSVHHRELRHRYVKEGALKLIAYYGLLSESEVRAFGGLPNKVSSSDHLPIMARFHLRL